MVTLEIRFRMSAKIHGMIKQEIFFYVFINVFMFPYELRRSMSVMLQIGSMICQAEIQIYFYFPLKVMPFGEYHLISIYLLIFSSAGITLF